jgi:hypothetical protein
MLLGLVGDLISRIGGCWKSRRLSQVGDLHAQVKAFVADYNHRRYHESIAGRSTMVSARAYHMHLRVWFNDKEPDRQAPRAGQLQCQHPVSASRRSEYWEATQRSKSGVRSFLEDRLPPLG